MVDPNETRRFDEKEFALIVRRATELQEKGAAPSTRAGLTLREIETIAAEAGIEPALIRRAALDLAGNRAPGLWRRIAGPSTHIHAERTIPGEVGADTLSAIVDAVRTELGRSGTAHDVLGGLEWTGRDSWGKVHITARPGGAETRLYVSADRSETAAVAATLLPIAGTILGGVAGSAVDFAPLLTAGLGAVGGLAGARFLWDGVARRWQSRVRVILDRVSAAIDNARQDRVGSVD
jgi:hypothetical protein